MIDIAQVRKLSPKNGDVFVLPAETSEEDACSFVAALHSASPGLKGVVIRGDIKQLSTADMNAAGWYRA
jgi:hypothetical protein